MMVVSTDPVHVRGPAAEGRHRKADHVPLQPAAQRILQDQRECPAGPRHGGLQPGPVPRALQPAGDALLLDEIPRRPAESLVQGSLQGGRKGARSSPWSGGQIPTAEEVPPAQDDLGWRGDGLLLQGEVAECSEGLLSHQSLSHARREEDAGQEDGPHAHPGLQLVQEPPSEGSHAPAETVS